MTKLVKICGIKAEDAAAKAIESGADLLGMILVPNRKRTVDHEVAQAISRQVKQARISKHRQYQSINELQLHISTLPIKSIKEYFEIVSQLLIENGPFLVGVFRNQSIEDVLDTASKLELDFIQLHGNENKVEYIKLINHKFGVIPRYVIPQQINIMPHDFEQIINFKSVSIPLLDSDAGGEGKVIDWNLINKELNFGNFILAGGLTPDNLKDTVTINNVIGYDVSGGVEDINGNKDFNKVEKFITIGKSI
ncbi:phosphoribosylanthranilate isomerase [Scheffersomyces amazonensis]|uniref:phosphoribosylanthranilate isomerase n=1 Tax=Scheffersomyces amazonensis TaxID=1078765 RepID=UPI00315C99BD